MKGYEIIGLRNSKNKVHSLLFEFLKIKFLRLLLLTFKQATLKLLPETQLKDEPKSFHLFKKKKTVHGRENVQVSQYPYLLTKLDACGGSHGSTR